MISTEILLITFPLKHKEYTIVAACIENQGYIDNWALDWITCDI